MQPASGQPKLRMRNRLPRDVGPGTDFLDHHASWAVWSARLSRAFGGVARFHTQYKAADSAALHNNPHTLLAIWGQTPYLPPTKFHCAMQPASGQPKLRMRNRLPPDTGPGTDFLDHRASWAVWSARLSRAFGGVVRFHTQYKAADSAALHGNPHTLLAIWGQIPDLTPTKPY